MLGGGRLLAADLVSVLWQTWGTKLTVSLFDVLKLSAKHLLTEMNIVNLAGIFISIKRGAYNWTPVTAQERLPHWASRTLFILTVFWRETINSFIWWRLTRGEVQKVKLCVLSAFPSNREQSYAMICPNKRDVFPLQPTSNPLLGLTEEEPSLICEKPCWDIQLRTA